MTFLGQVRSDTLTRVVEPIPVCLVMLTVCSLLKVTLTNESMSFEVRPRIYLFRSRLSQGPSRRLQIADCQKRTNNGQITGIWKATAGLTVDGQ